MNDQESFGPLEERLTREAQRMLADDSGKTPIPALRSEFLRRRGRRRLVRTVAAAAAVVALGFLMRGWNHLPEQIDQRIAVDQGTALETNKPNQTMNSSPHESSDERAVANGENYRQAPGALFILIEHVGENGETEYLPGWYVPEQVSAVDSADLSAAERAAAFQLLGPEINTSSDETI